MCMSLPTTDRVHAALHDGRDGLQAGQVAGDVAGQDGDVTPVCLLVSLVGVRLAAGVIADLQA